MHARWALATLLLLSLNKVHSTQLSQNFVRILIIGTHSFIITFFIFSLLTSISFFFHFFVRYIDFFLLLKIKIVHQG
jgi:hypothetical protein